LKELRTFLEQAPVAIAIFDTGQNYLACSARWREIFALPVTVVGKSPCSAPLHMPECWRDAHRRAMRGEIVKAGEDLIETGAANPLWLGWEAHPWRLEQGLIGGVTIYAEDVTDRRRIDGELRESEQRFRWALQSAGGGAWSWDLANDESWWSDEMYDLWGVARGTLIKSRSSFYVVLDEDRPKLRAASEAAIAGQTSFNCEYRINHPVRGVRWMISVGHFRADTVGSRRRMVGLTFDITELKKAGESLQRLNRLDAMAEIAGNIAHDANNLLTVILANLQLAEPRIADERAHNWLLDAMRAAEVGASNNRRLLSLAQTRTLAPLRINLNPSVEKTAQLVARSLGDDIRLKLDLSSDLWWSMADPGDIESAVLNLAGNARDAMPVGGTLQISTTNCDLTEDEIRQKIKVIAGQFVKLKVTDTGTGMEPEILKRAGEPMFTTKGPNKGNGLGLSSIITFARQAGGFVEVESATGEGTAVSVYLPRSAEPQGMQEAPSPYQLEIPLDDVDANLGADGGDDARMAKPQRAEAAGKQNVSEDISARGGRQQFQTSGNQMLKAISEAKFTGATDRLGVTKGSRRPRIQP
jgi:PAS domain S-box-containing protein